MISSDGRHIEVIGRLGSGPGEFRAPWDARYFPDGGFAVSDPELERHMQLRKILKTWGHFPTDEAAMKLPYLALRNIKKRWAPAPAWQAALTHFTLLCPDRFAPEA